jgi:hypothetical protein
LICQSGPFQRAPLHRLECERANDSSRIVFTNGTAWMTSRVSNPCCSPSGPELPGRSRKSLESCLAWAQQGRGSRSRRRGSPWQASRRVCGAVFLLGAAREDLSPKVVANWCQTLRRSSPALGARGTALMARDPLLKADSPSVGRMVTIRPGQTNDQSRTLNCLAKTLTTISLSYCIEKL